MIKELNKLGAVLQYAVFIIKTTLMLALVWPDFGEVVEE